MKKIDELQNVNKRKNRFSIREVKDSKRPAKFCTGLQNHGVFMLNYNRIYKKAQKCNISGEIHLLLLRTIKQVKIIKNEGRSHLYPLKTGFFFLLILLNTGLRETDLAFRFQLS